MQTAARAMAEASATKSSRVLENSLMLSKRILAKGFKVCHCQACLPQNSELSPFCMGVTILSRTVYQMIREIFWNLSPPRECYSTEFQLRFCSKGISCVSRSLELGPSSPHCIQGRRDSHHCVQLCQCVPEGCWGAGTAKQHFRRITGPEKQQ